MNIKMLNLKHMGRVWFQSEPNRINGLGYPGIISVLCVYYRIIEQIGLLLISVSGSFHLLFSSPYRSAGN